jgi:transcriptional regulator with GAF, ATPase, and Fis domain
MCLTLLKAGFNMLLRMVDAQHMLGHNELVQGACSHYRQGGAKEMARQRRDYYQSVYQITSTLNSTRDARTLLHSIVESVAKAMEAKACSLMLLTAEKDVLKGKPVAVLDATTDERVVYREQAKKEGIASMLSVPMKLRGEVIGVLRVYTAKPYRFTRDDTHFVDTIANLGAVALENLRAYDMLQKDYETFRRDLLQWSAALGHEWMMGETVKPPKEEGPRIPPGG